ncbi:MAG: carbon-nitrogen hydrolase family protein [Bacteroidales bacterium]|nr:carbon-nitrogen hydrolase family protein [Bacteroidales bacterium]
MNTLKKLKLTTGRFLTIIIVLLCLSCQEDDTIVQSLFDLSGAPLIYDNSNADRRLKVVAVSMVCSKDKGANLDRMCDKAKEAKNSHPEAELILFGESVLGWYIDDEHPEPYQRSIAETIPGPATDSVAIIAEKLGCHIGFGLTETNHGTLYNSFVLIDPDGEIVATHRKVNLAPEDILGGITPAAEIDSSVTMVLINNIKVGMIICADANGVWLTRELTDRGVEVILHPMASEVPMFKIDAGSRQFNAWEVFANRYGEELGRQYSGTTFIADPSGCIRIGDSGKEGFYFYNIGVN